MNKLVIREALKCGLAIRGNSILCHNYQIDLNSFLIEINKLHFTHSLGTSIDIFKENLLRNDLNKKEQINE